MATIWDALKQYVRDAAPGGLLNAEVPKDMPTEVAKGLLSFTPGVGDAISGYDAIQSARQGNYGEAALNGLGVLPFVPGMAKYYHGSKSGVDWLVNGEKFSESAPSANMKSKYLWGNPRQEVAENYAGVSDMALWKAENGMGSYPSNSAGVAMFETSDKSKKYKLNKFDQIAKDYGIDTKSGDWLEKLMDSLKADGYDVLVNNLDGGNVAILNADVVKKAKKIK